MKYIYQAGTIFLFTFLGEVLARVIPLPIPAAIWGLILLFIGLLTGIVKEKDLGECARFLIGMLPLLFVAPTVNLMDSVGILLPKLWAVVLMILLSTLITFVVSGKTCSWILRQKKVGEKS